MSGTVGGGNYEMPINPWKDGKIDAQNKKTLRFNEMIATNEQGVASLSAEELAEIAKWDGNAELSANDLIVAGVDPTVAKDLAALAKKASFQTVGLTFKTEAGTNEFVPPRLETAIRTPLTALLKSRPDLGVSTTAQFDSKLQQLPELQRNPLIASITYDLAGEMSRTETLSKHATVFAKYVAGVDNNATVKPLPSSMSATDISNAIVAVTNHPDLAQASVHDALTKLGHKMNANPSLKATVLDEVNKKFNFNPPLKDLTDVRDRNALINAQRNENLKAIDARATTLYATFGGTEPRPTVISLATGDGTGTYSKLADKPNHNIANNRYGNTAGFAPKTQSALTGLNQARTTFKASAPDKPVVINMNAFGANMGKDVPAGATGNTVSVEYRDAQGNSRSVDFKVYLDPATKLSKMEPAAPIKDPNIAYDPATGSLTIKKPGNNPLSIIQRSGGSNGSYDEIFVNLMVTGAREVPSTEVNIALQDHFKPNQWDLTIDQMPDFRARVAEVSAFRQANHVPPVTAEVTGNGVGTLAKGQVVKSKQGDWSGTYANNGTTANAQSHLRYSELSYDLKTGQITVNSFTDPARATLTEAGFGDQVAMMRQKDPKLSENDILSGLRAFAVYEAFEKEAAKNGDQIGLLQDLKVAIGANGAVMTYADYQAFNVQRDAVAQK